jgi:tetratricopeptide (TPR) repeat protein
MNLHSRRHIAVRLSLSLLTLGPLAARAQSAATDGAGQESRDVEQARKHFGQGLKLYKDGDFDAALVQFERAYAMKPNFKVLYNIAQCHFELRQYVEARDTLSRYLKDGVGSIETERQSAVQNDLAELERRIAHLTLKVNVTGATVYIDGKKAGVTPLGKPVDVNEGQRTISVETADRGSKQRIVRVAGGEAQTVSVDFAAPAPSQLAVDGSGKNDGQRRQASNGLGAGFWITGGLAVALGASAGATGYFALRAQDDHDDALKRFGVSADELGDAQKRAENFALTTDILAGSAIVFAGIATVLLVSHDSGREQVGLGVGPGNLTLRGKF